MQDSQLKAIRKATARATIETVAQTVLSSLTREPGYWKEKAKLHNMSLSKLLAQEISRRVIPL